MPLRVSWSYDGSEKTRTKMSHKGHYAKVRKPTGPELYEEASRILDELLQKQIGAGLQLHGRRRPPRFKTYPPPNRLINTGDILDERDEEDMDGSCIPERSKTMPSQARGSTKETFPSKESQLKRRDSSGSASSADTEGDSELVSASRKKKSLLKKVKEKFLRTVQREDREKQMRENSKQGPDHSPKSKAANKGKKDKNGLKYPSRKTGDKYRGDVDSKNSSQSSHIDDGSGVRKNSAGMAFFNTIRRSFSIKRSRRDYAKETLLIFEDTFCPDGAGDESSTLGRGTSGSSKSQTPSPVKEGSSSLPTPQIVPPPRHPESSSLPKPQTGPPPPPPPPAPPKGTALTIPSQDKSTSPYPNSSSTDTHHNDGDKSSSLYSIASMHQDHRSRIGGVLTDTFDDIKFMDESDDGNDGRGGDFGDYVQLQENGHGDVLHGGTASYRSEWDGRRQLKQQNSLCVDGDTEDDVHDGKDSLPLHERSEEEKGEMFGKIAQKLIDMGETYAAESGFSDSEHHIREQSGAESGDGLMNDLERQILECLRDVGDRNSRVLDDCAQEIMEEAKAKTYERFKQTMQHSLGEEISWNHLALLFYTSKGVMTAVGKGSTLARDVKEMTLHYFSDKFAKWIMDQGGFDGILSDSDSELD